MKKEKIGIYPGSFDPVTNGHMDIIKRSIRLVDKLIVGVLNNSEKSPLFSVDERVKMLQEATKELSNVTIMSFNGLTVDFAKDMNAHIIIRGLRAISDFEYELQIAQMNHKLYPDVDTIFLTTSIEHSYLSSSVVKEVARYGEDISGFVPPNVLKMLECKNIK
ncbi:MAG: pantetheine-phosphate adenylyltransferase [Lachnospiraceae bacterium]|jgi:pantetheine-phosphate adenylyltransferase|nr:pantetheine-phosphate adenylyltransferase [Lachnospiraceae bacterium]